MVRTPISFSLVLPLLFWLAFSTTTSLSIAAIDSAQDAAQDLPSLGGNGSSISCTKGRRPAPTARDKTFVSKLPGCNTLLNSKLRPEDKENLLKCLDGIRLSAVIGGGLEQRKQRIREFPPAVRDFLAMVYTSSGESYGYFKTSERVAIMRTVYNRTQLCKKKKPNCDAWSVATEPAQFSMYNSNLYPKNPVMHLSPYKDQRISKSVEAYIAFQSAKMSPQWSRVVNYHSNSIGTPGSWKVEPISHRSLLVDGQQAQGGGMYYHKFFAASYSPKASIAISSVKQNDHPLCLTRETSSQAFSEGI